MNAHHQNKLQANSGGFTLIEVTIVISLFALVLVVFLNIFDWSNGNYAYQQAYLRATTSARQAMTDMQTATLQASSVLSSHSIDGTVYSSGSSTMVLELPAIDTNGDIIDSTWDYIVFYVSNGSLYRLADINALSTREMPEIKLLSDSVEVLTFTYNTVDFAQVSSVDAALTTAIAVRDQIAKSSFRQSWYLRNK
jgi:prepilin-type N-terminal cleavage/methylation domain-containing protein